MKCPSCQHSETKVVDSRLTEKGIAIRRRRECEKCGFRFTTFERREYLSLIVTKKDGTSEPYNRDKAESGILKALKKRPFTSEAVQNLVNELEEKWSNKKEITSEEIGEDILKKLRDLDEVAYIRFASVYRSFQDIKSFERELKKLQKKN